MLLLIPGFLGLQHVDIDLSVVGQGAPQAPGLFPLPLLQLQERILTGAGRMDVMDDWGTFFFFLLKGR